MPNFRRRSAGSDAGALKYSRAVERPGSEDYLAAVRVLDRSINVDFDADRALSFEQDSPNMAAAANREVKTVPRRGEVADRR